MKPKNLVIVRAVREQGLTPEQAYTALPKATPTGPTRSEWRSRTDKVDEHGKVTVRYAGQRRHLGISKAHAEVRTSGYSESGEPRDALMLIVRINAPHTGGFDNGSGALASCDAVRTNSANQEKRTSSTGGATVLTVRAV